MKIKLWQKDSVCSEVNVTYCAFSLWNRLGVRTLECYLRTGVDGRGGEGRGGGKGGGGCRLWIGSYKCHLHLIKCSIIENIRVYTVNMFCPINLCSSSIYIAAGPLKRKLSGKLN